MPKLILFLLLLGAGLIFALWDMTASPPGQPIKTSKQTQTTNNAKDNQMAPDITFTDLKGASHSLASFRGQTVMINVWATWCPPCIAEMPQLLELASQDREQLVLIALSVDENADTITRFFDRMPPEHREKLDLKNVTIAHDPDKAISKDILGTTLYPETYIISPSGVMTHKIKGVTDWLGVEVKRMIYQD